MKFNGDYSNDYPAQTPQVKPLSLDQSQKMVTTYTALCILVQMKSTLGLEAMLDYMESYQSIIEKNNPRLKSAVKKALRLMSVEKMYKDAVDGEKR